MTSQTCLVFNVLINFKEGEQEEGEELPHFDEARQLAVVCQEESSLRSENDAESKPLAK